MSRTTCVGFTGSPTTTAEEIIVSCSELGGSLKLTVSVRMKCEEEKVTFFCALPLVPAYVWLLRRRHRPLLSAAVIEVT
jgi:hypothetical protein